MVVQLIPWFGETVSSSNLFIIITSVPLCFQRGFAHVEGQQGIHGTLLVYWIEM